MRIIIYSIAFPLILSFSLLAQSDKGTEPAKATDSKKDTFPRIQKHSLSREQRLKNNYLGKSKKYNRLNNFKDVEIGALHFINIETGEILIGIENPLGGIDLHNPETGEILVANVVSEEHISYFSIKTGEIFGAMKNSVGGFDLHNIQTGEIVIIIPINGDERDYEFGY